MSEEQSENAEKSPWDALVDELGVKPPDEALERHQPASQQVPSHVAREERAVPPQAAPSDWEGLASSLGLENPGPTPDRNRPREKPERKVERLTSTKFDVDTSAGLEQSEIDFLEEPESDRVGSRDRDDEADSMDLDSHGEAAEAQPETADRPRMSGDAARSAFDALFSPDAASWGSAFVSPRTNVESSFLFTEGEEAVFAEEITDDSDIEDEDEALEAPAARHRRERGGRSRQKQDSTTAEREIVDESGGAGESEEGHEQQADLGKEVTPATKKRRRRGRGRSKRPAATADDAEDLTVDSESEAVDKDPAAVGGSSSRSTHRNLPTWDEAVGVVVEANLAQRAKSSSKQNASRGRGRGGKRHKKS